MTELNSEAIDFRVASEHRKLKKSDLKTLRLITKDQGRKRGQDQSSIMFCWLWTCELNFRIQINSSLSRILKG